MSQWSDPRFLALDPGLQAERRAIAARKPSLEGRLALRQELAALEGRFAW